MNRNSTIDDLELFHQFALGREDAFRSIFETYFPLLVSYVFRITHTQHTAEEITQEAFLRFWQKRSTFSDTSELKAWLYKVAANLAFDHLKREAYHNRLVGHYSRQSLATDDTEQWLNLRESKTAVEAAVSALPDQQKLIYRLSREEGLSHQEIAERLNLSPNTVKNHMVKALQTLRNQLKNAAQFFFSFFF